MIMRTFRAWAAATIVLAVLGATDLARAQFTFLTPGDPRVITAEVEFELLSTSNGVKNFQASISTTQNDEILGKARGRGERQVAFEHSSWARFHVRVLSFALAGRVRFRRLQLCYLHRRPRRRL